MTGSVVDLGKRENDVSRKMLPPAVLLREMILELLLLGLVSALVTGRQMDHKGHTKRCTKK